MLIGEIMTRDPAVCHPNTRLEVAARLMLENDCGAIPVVEGDRNRRPSGIITDRDITLRTVAEGKNPFGMTVMEVMSGQVATVRPDDTLDHAARIMAELQVRRLVVVDAQGDCVGMVSQAQLADHLTSVQAGEMLQGISREGNWRGDDEPPRGDGLEAVERLRASSPGPAGASLRDGLDREREILDDIASQSPPTGLPGYPG